MNEKLLHFIWQFQYYNKSSLVTSNEEQLHIVHTGTYNNNQGPDFLNATVKIDEITLVGNIELHIHASDWNKHKHSSDLQYNNIVLHVVWNNDLAITLAGKPLPTLELNGRVPKYLLQRYEYLMLEQQAIPCAKFLPALSEIGWLAWKERLAIERLEQKSKHVLQLFDSTNHHWEEVFWQLIARNFGITINADCFEAIAQTISINVLAKHKNQIHQLEALLLGQANLLNDNFDDKYAQLLQKEYHFLQRKYQLKKVHNTPLFLRMRPANFPTIRLAQLAMLIYNSNHLFAKIKLLTEIKEVKLLFAITANDYWNTHYTLNDETSSTQPKELGQQMIHNIIINTVVPILFSYGLYTKEQLFKDKALKWLQELPTENNKIIHEWKMLEVKYSNAFDSQALLQLTNNYCKQHNCLQCAVGNKILKQE